MVNQFLLLSLSFLEERLRITLRLLNRLPDDSLRVIFGLRGKLPGVGSGLLLSLHRLLLNLTDRINGTFGHSYTSLGDRFDPRSSQSVRITP